MRKLNLVFLGVGAAAVCVGLVTTRKQQPAVTTSGNAGQESLTSSKPVKEGKPLIVPIPQFITPASPTSPESTAVSNGLRDGIDPNLSELRRSLVSAIRTRHRDPVQKREAMVQALRGSGPSNEAWTSQAAAVFASWQSAMPADARQHLKIGSATCYRAGCSVEVAFPDAQTQEMAATAIRNLAVEDSRHGGRVITPATTGANNELTATWIMLRPEPEAEQANR